MNCVKCECVITVGWEACSASLGAALGGCGALSGMLTCDD